eukprot:INCI2823.1.p1 GENE.INCI2823.1~~INCI2823.1.p1  ORF type:complete len:693 (-),score=128.23 INCI2823.1:33-1943(-)
MSDVSSFDDEDDDDDSGGGGGESSHNGGFDESNSQQTAQSITDRPDPKSTASQPIDERARARQTLLSREKKCGGADERVPKLQEDSGIEEESPLISRLQVATRFNVHPVATRNVAAGDLLHSLHLAQTSDSVETIHSLSRVITGADGKCVAQSFFTCATYQQQGVDKSVKGAGQQTTTSSLSSQSAASGVSVATTANEESKKSGTVLLFCLEQQRVSTDKVVEKIVDAKESSRLYLLDEIDAGSAVFDVAWLCDGPWASCPMMAVACADSAVRLFTLVQPTDLHESTSKGRGGETPGSLGVITERFRQSHTLHMISSFALPGNELTPVDSACHASGQAFDNSMVRVLSVRWDRERKQQRSEGTRNVLTTHSDGTAAVWTCFLGNTGADSVDPARAPAVRLRSLWDAHSYFGAPSEVWTGCFDVHHSKRVFTGADDGKLKLWEWDDDADVDDSPFLLQEHNAGLDGHGVTVIRPHPSGVLATGSYDGSVNIWNPHCILQGPLRKYSCTGGVWRLQWHPSISEVLCSDLAPVAEPRQLLLAACMRGGAHVLDLSQVFPFVAEVPDGTTLESAETQNCAKHAESEQLHAWQAAAHADGSIVYGADWIFSDRYCAATCSFYDCHLAVWSLDDELGGGVIR